MLLFDSPFSTILLFLPHTQFFRRCLGKPFSGCWLHGYSFAYTHTLALTEMGNLNINSNRQLQSIDSRFLVATSERGKERKAIDKLVAAWQGTLTQSVVAVVQPPTN